MSKVNKITFFVLSVLLLVLGFAFIYGGVTKRAVAEGDGTSVDYANQLSLLKVEAYKYNENDNLTSVAKVTNNGFVLLENAETSDLSKPKQGVRFVIRAQGENVYLPALEVNVFLNGKQLSLGDAYVTDENLGSGISVSNNSLIFDILIFSSYGNNWSELKLILNSIIGISINYFNWTIADINS